MIRLLVLLFAAALAVRAEEKPPEPARPAPEIPEAAVVHARKRPVERLRVVEGNLVTSGETVNASDVVDEMLDELAADVAKLGGPRVGPLLLQRIQVSDNMNPEYASILEARLASAIYRAANIALIVCHECFALKSRLENGSWVVSRGITGRDQLKEVARKYGAQTMLAVSLSLQDRPNSMAMDVEMVRAEDSSIAFAENYRLDAGRALLYRGADTAQAREARLQQIEDRLNQRPHLQTAAELGFMRVDSDQGAIWGGTGRFILTEPFADRFSAGLSLGGFLNTTTLAGGILGGVFQARIGDPAFDAPEWSLVINPGMLITGNAGNAMLLLGGLRLLGGVRLALHADVGYLASFQINNKGATYGGLVTELGVSFVWR